MASVTKDTRSPYWWARYRDGAGNEFTRSTKQKQKANALQVAFEMERMARGEVPTMAVIERVGREMIERLGQTLDAPTVAEEFQNYLSLLDTSTRAASTKEGYRQMVEDFLTYLGKGGEKKLTSLTAGDIESLTGNEGGLLGKQELNGPGNVVGLTKST